MLERVELNRRAGFDNRVRVTVHHHFQISAVAHPQLLTANDQRAIMAIPDKARTGAGSHHDGRPVAQVHGSLRVEVVDVNVAVVAALDLEHLLLQRAWRFVKQSALLFFELEIFPVDVLALLVPGELFLLSFLSDRRSSFDFCGFVGVVLAVLVTWLLPRCAIDESCDAGTHLFKF